MTFGEAVDDAIRQHKARYPESDVYKIRAVTMESLLAQPGHYYRVELDASHFSVALVYYAK